jgi:hypothetical protein
LGRLLAQRKRWGAQRGAAPQERRRPQPRLHADGSGRGALADGGEGGCPEARGARPSPGRCGPGLGQTSRRARGSLETEGANVSSPGVETNTSFLPSGRSIGSSTGRAKAPSVSVTVWPTKRAPLPCSPAGDR